MHKYRYYRRFVCYVALLWLCYMNILFCLYRKQHEWHNIILSLSVSKAAFMMLLYRKVCPVYIIYKRWTLRNSYRNDKFQWILTFWPTFILLTLPQWYCSNEPKLARERHLMCATSKYVIKHTYLLINAIACLYCCREEF